MKQIPRVIPALLLRDRGFVKTERFDNAKYLGDPLNILKIFNEKEVDEIVVLDISATPAKRGPNLKILKEMATECFMPLGYGGGIRNLADVDAILNLGLEKVVLNTALVENPDLVSQVSKKYGAQSVAASIDVKKTGLLKRSEAFSHCGTRKTGMSPEAWAKRAEDLGAGEILLNSIDRDGTFTGFDVELIKKVSAAVSIPVIALGGASSVADLVTAVRDGGASAVAAGSFFVYHGPHRAVLINVPSPKTLREAFR